MTDLLPCRALYRISLDPHDKRAGVSRQRTDCHALAPKLGWTIEREHTDNNRSGWKHGVRREAYEELVADIDAGKVRAVIAYDQDRVTRQTEEWGRFRRLCKRQGVRVAFVNDGGEIAISTTSGGLSTGVRALLAEGESETKSDKVKSAHAARALAGQTASCVNYGWRRERTYNDRGIQLSWCDVEHPEHAAIVREIVERIVQGHALRRIAEDLNDRAVPVPNAGQKNAAALWRPGTIRKLALRPANVGQRVHRGKVLPGVTAQAPAIVDADLWRKACAVLSARSGGTNRVANLLTGLLRCEVCGSPVRVQRRTGVTTIYVCESSTGCAATSQPVADEYVTAYVIAYLGSIDPAALIVDETGENDVNAAQDELVALSDRRKAARQMFLAGTIDADDWAEILAEIGPMIESAKRRAVVHVSPGLNAAYTLAESERVAEAWARLPIEVQRAVVRAIFVLTLAPANGTRKRQRISVTPTR